ncbi:MAG: DUF6036 family nucleotidyltransferase [Thermoplasmata archaeon]
MEKAERKEERPLRLLKVLRSEGIRHVVVGGFAAVVYGVGRATFDIDIALAPSPADIERLIEMLVETGYSSAVDPETGRRIADTRKLTPKMILERECTRFRNKDSIDIMIVPLDTFDFLWKYRVEVEYEGVKISVPSLIDLIHLKEQSGRPVDLQDAKELRHILRTRKGRY